MSIAGTGVPSQHTALPRTDHVPPLPERALPLLRAVARARYSRRYRIEVHGKPYVPAHGSVLLASNHIGHLDRPILVAVAPRRVHALAEREMFTGATGRLLSAAGQVPVARTDADPCAVRRCVRALRDGRVVAVFPEGPPGAGGVTHSRRGLAYLGLVTGAPVVPVAVLGTRLPGQSVHDHPPSRARVVVAFGRPQRVAPQAWPRRRAEVGALAERLRAVLADHVAATVAVTGIELPGRPPDRAHEGTP